MALLDMKQSANGLYELHHVSDASDETIGAESARAESARAESNGTQSNSEQPFQHGYSTKAQAPESSSFYAQHLNQLHEQMQQQQQDYLNQMRSAFSASREQMIDQLNKMKTSGNL